MNCRASSATVIRLSVRLVARVGSGEAALEKAGASLVNAKMLVGFYFPSLAPALACTIAAVTTAHGALRRWEGAEAATSGDDLLIALDRDVAALKDALEIFKTAIIETGRAARQPASFVVRRRPAKLPPEGRVLRVAA